jgi:hypothetical protein
MLRGLLKVAVKGDWCNGLQPIEAGAQALTTRNVEGYMGLMVI